MSGLRRLVEAANAQRSGTYEPLTHKTPTALIAARYRTRDLTGANGSTVNRLPDLSGNGQDMVQFTTANQPTVKTNGLNGGRTLVFDTTDFLACATFGAGWPQPSGYAQPITIVAVVKMSSGGAATRTIVGGGSSAANQVNMITTTSNGALQLFAGSAGARGGPNIHDDTWHVLIVQAQTGAGLAMVDGYVVGAASTQTHGTGQLAALGIGAVNGGGTPGGPLEVAEVIVIPGRPSFPALADLLAITSSLSSDYGLGLTLPTQDGVVWRDVTDTGGQSVRLFLPRTISASMPLVIYCHQQAGTTGITPGFWSYTLIHALVNAGYIVAVPNNHGADSWSNDSALTDLVNARSYVNTNVATVRRSVLVGASMGGSLAVIAAKAGTLSDLKGVYLIDAAVNLGWMYDNAYSTSINTGFGIASKAAIPAGKDPVTLTSGQLPAGMRWRSIASAADVTVSKTNNIDLLDPIITGATPAEWANTTHGSTHLDPSASVPADVVAFANRAV